MLRNAQIAMLQLVFRKFSEQPNRESRKGERPLGWRTVEDHRGRILTASASSSSNQR